MEDRKFHQHRAYVVMLIAKWLTGQETVTAKDLVNFLNEKSFVPRSTHVTGIQMQVHRTVRSAILQKEGEEDNVQSEQEERTIVMDEKEEIYYESENLNVRSASYSFVENKGKKRKLPSSIEDNDTDAHHTLENETAIILGRQVSQQAESQVEPSSPQLKSRQSPPVPTIVLIQYEGLQGMARVNSMAELYNVVTERFPESGNVSLICEGTVLDDSVCFD
ncbi:Hypothetical predicted protein [Mytilus galloprovincialis]|uniref:Uncharacterized protein n=1 Tax=Mytilus galloprovincialis TaxID=29158 RepID=A0A8B6D2I1_MYTGA|nr:Hypothetical predicted protein [Mytilus galloprovincialis]